MNALTYKLETTVFSLPFALAMTCALFVFMHLLIHRDYKYTEPKPPIKIVSPIAIDPPPITPEFEAPKKPLPPVEPPPTEIHHATELPNDGGIAFAPGYTPPDIPVGNGAGLGGQLIALTKVAPIYPQRQIARGIEGFVDVGFTVTATGATTNIRIIQSQPKGAFDRAATRAVQKWKYKPREVDGVAILTEGLVERVRFAIEK